MINRTFENKIALITRADDGIGTAFNERVIKKI